MMRQRGFTIIEVMLFLAISGLLLALALAGVTSAIQNTRFSDSTKSLEAYLQQQYSEVYSGVLARSDSDRCTYDTAQDTVGASNSCIAIGRLLALNTTGQVITSYQMTGKLDAPVDTDDLMAIAATVPHVMLDATKSSAISVPYQTEWGSTFTKLQYGASKDFNRIAILHSPVSEAIVTLFYNDANPVTRDTVIPPSALTAAHANQQALLCIQSQGGLPVRKAYASFTGGQGVDVIKSGGVETLSLGGLTC